MIIWLYAEPTTPGGSVAGFTVMTGQMIGGGMHTEMALLARVTAPLRARALPDTVAPVFRVMLVSARMLPCEGSVCAERRGAADLPEHVAAAEPPLIT